jgi:hypothetical protein
VAVPGGGTGHELVLAAWVVGKRIGIVGIDGDNVVVGRLVLAAHEGEHGQ